VAVSGALLAEDSWHPAERRVRALPSFYWAAVLGLVVLVAAVPSVHADGAPSLWTEVNAATSALPALQQLNDALVTLTQRVLPAVVSLQVHPKAGQTAPPKTHPPLRDDAPPYYTGSGFIIRADGLMLTNYHVVEDTVSVDVLLYDGELTSAKVIGHDPVGDLALLQISIARPLPVVPLGSSAALQVGEFVVAVGSPFGFEHTITFGIVSAKKRHFLRSSVLGGFIQTDAAINTGNSGGPLLNMRGEVVGINTATIGRSELGFAIPIDAAKAVLPQLYSARGVTRGWLGVNLRPLERGQARALGLEPPHGVYVNDVLGNQPAQQGGILAGDIILSLDGQLVTTPFELQSLVAAMPIGKKVLVQLLRKQARHTVELTVGTMPAPREP
jgi:serine protease Do